MANNLQPLMDALLLCLCQTLTADGNPVCECCIVRSDGLPPMTGCDCRCAEPEGGQGRAWIRFVDGNWQQPQPVKCPIGPWEVQLQAGIYRCATSDVDCVSQAADATKILDDLSSIDRAIRCCPALRGKNFTLGAAQSLLSGNCQGVTIDFTVQIGNL